MPFISSTIGVHQGVGIAVGVGVGAGVDVESHAVSTSTIKINITLRVCVRCAFMSTVHVGNAEHVRVSPHLNRHYVLILIKI